VCPDAASGPSGNVTLLFTDIVGSTAAWERDPVAMAESSNWREGPVRTMARLWRTRTTTLSVIRLPQRVEQLIQVDSPNKQVDMPSPHRALGLQRLSLTRLGSTIFSIGFMILLRRNSFQSIRRSQGHSSPTSTCKMIQSTRLWHSPQTVEASTKEK
jgi:hypothetical protein